MRKTGDEDVEGIERRTQPSLSATCWTESGAFPPKKPETDKASCESPPQKIFFFDTKKEKSRFQGRTTQFLLKFVLMFIVVEGRG